MIVGLRSRSRGEQRGGVTHRVLVVCAAVMAFWLAVIAVIATVVR